MSDISSRMFVETDKEELNSLYNLVAGRSRNIEEFEWEWLNTPEGWGSMWLIVDNETEKIIGHHGMIPVMFSYYGRKVLTGKTENTVMDPQYRGRGIYTPFESRFIGEAKERYALTWTNSGIREQGRVRLKVGYGIVGRYAHYFRFVSVSGLNEWFGKLAAARIKNGIISRLVAGTVKVFSPVIMAFFRRNVPRDDSIKLEEIHDMDSVSDELDEFWERNKEYFGITVDRNSAYLKWRIFENPNIKYNFLMARRQGEIAGYAVTWNDNESQVMITDLVAAKGDEIIANSILHGIAEREGESGGSLMMFTTLYSKNSLNTLLRKNGFLEIDSLKLLLRKAHITRKIYPLFMVNALDENLDVQKVFDSSEWYYTDIYSEGVK